MSDTAYRPSVYVETTVPSYLTAWPSRDPTRSLHQRLTIQWWRGSENQYDRFVSQPVLEEASQGDPHAVRDRMAALVGIPVVPFSPAAVTLAGEYATILRLPDRARLDALHVAYAAVYRVDYLLTWNMRHLASAFTRRQISDYNMRHGLNVPLIVTPGYLLDLMQTDGEETP